MGVLGVSFAGARERGVVERTADEARPGAPPAGSAAGSTGSSSAAPRFAAPAAPLTLTAPTAPGAGATPAATRGMSDTSCTECHQAQISSMAATVHRGSATASGFKSAVEDLQAICASCHGPIAPHGAPATASAAAAMAPYAKRTASERSAPCLVCHTGALTVHWSGSVHEARDIACTDCHTMHPKGAPLRGLPSQQDEVRTCLSCHRTLMPAMWQSSHHPVREGRMVCSGCHEPHGTLADAQLRRSTVNETCFECHADKRGPYLWTHPPVVENCLNCHVAHGSLHDSLLIMKPPRLCQTCHGEPTTSAVAGVPRCSFSTRVATTATRSTARTVRRDRRCCDERRRGHGPPPAEARARTRVRRMARLFRAKRVRRCGCRGGNKPGAPADTDRYEPPTGAGCRPPGRRDDRCGPHGSIGGSAAPFRPDRYEPPAGSGCRAPARADRCGPTAGIERCAPARPDRCRPAATAPS